jgi:hypothetical protein
LNRPSFPTRPDPDRFTRRNAELLERIASAAPGQLAAATGAKLQPTGQFLLDLWGREVLLTPPTYSAHWNLTGAPVGQMDQALLLYYLATADGVPPAERWVSFADLPDGRFYNQAFQGYTGQELARAFGNDLAAFIAANQSLGGHPYPLGQAAYTYQPLPRTPVLVVYWLGDEDFPASAQILFDASASHYLPTDAYAILGSALTRRLINARAG